MANINSSFVFVVDLHTKHQPPQCSELCGGLIFCYEAKTNSVEAQAKGARVSKNPRQLSQIHISKSTLTFPWSMIKFKCMNTISRPSSLKYFSKGRNEIILCWHQMTLSKGHKRWPPDPHSCPQSQPRRWPCRHLLLNKLGSQHLEGIVGEIWYEKNITEYGYEDRIEWNKIQWNKDGEYGLTV